MDYDPGTVEALRVVEEVAREAVDAGTAKITVEHSRAPGWLINLTPTNPRACAVWLAVEAYDPPAIFISLGREPTTAAYELRGDDYLVDLRASLEAVVAGRCQQRVETFKRNASESKYDSTLPTASTRMTARPASQPTSNQARSTRYGSSRTSRHNVACALSSGMCPTGRDQ